MSHWWRAHDEAVDDPKLQLIPDSLFRAWFNVMCLCSANEGVLPPIDHVAFKLRITPGKAAKLVDALVDVKLLDVVDKKFQPHNWNERQFKSDVTDPTNAERQKRYRKRHAVTEIVTEKTVTVTPTRLQSTETEKKDAADAAPTSEDVSYYRRIREVLGENAGGLGKQLLNAKSGSYPLARAAIEQASTKGKGARDYIGAIIRGRPPPEADQQKRIDQFREQNRTAVVLATDMPGGIPGIK